MTSISTAVQTVSVLFSTFIIATLMDIKGRKFVCVHVKFLISLFTSISFLFAYFFQSSVCIIVAISIVGMASPITMMADTIFFVELGSGKANGYFATAVSVIGSVVSGTLLIFISKPTVLGTDELWYVAVLIAMVANVLFYAVAYSFEETISEKSMTVSSVVTQRISLFKEILSNEYYRTVFVLILLVHQMPRWAAYSIEMVYPIQLYEREGMGADQTLSMHVIVFWLTAPFHFIGPIVNAKMSRANFLRLDFVGLQLKNLLHIVNLGVFVPAIGGTISTRIPQSDRITSEEKSRKTN